MPISVIVLLGFYLLFWQGYKLRGRFSGVAHLSLILALVGVLSIAIFARLEDAHAFGDADPRYLRLYANLLTVGQCTAVYVFRFAADSTLIAPHRRRRITAVLLTSAAMAIAMVIVTMVIVSRGEPLRYSVDTAQHPLGATFYVVVGCYFGVLLALTARWMWRASRDKERHFMIGIRVAAIGVGTLSGICFVRAFPVLGVALFGWTSLAPAFLLGLGSTLHAVIIYAGLSYPLVAERVRAWRSRQRRADSYDQLQPLWQLSATAYPEMILPAHPLSTDPTRSSADGRVVPGRFRYDRRVAECFDALCRVRKDTGERLPTAQREAVETLHAIVRSYEEAHPDQQSIWRAVDAGERDSIRSEEQFLAELSTIAELMESNRHPASPTLRGPA